MALRCQEHRLYQHQQLFPMAKKDPGCRSDCKIFVFIINFISKNWDIISAVSIPLYNHIYILVCCISIRHQSILSACSCKSNSHGFLPHPLTRCHAQLARAGINPFDMNLYDTQAKIVAGCTLVGEMRVLFREKPQTQLT